MKKILFLLFFIILAAHPVFAASNRTHWVSLRPGLEYSNLKLSVDDLGNATVHTFRIDPQLFSFRVAQAASNQKLGAGVDELAKNNAALLAVNGGFFTEEHRSIGLLMSQGKILNRLHNTSWWSIFTLSKTNEARIFSPRLYAENDNQLDFAVQAGPRLVINGEIPEFRDRYADRTALGITPDGKLLLVVTEGSGLLLQQLAEIFVQEERRGGLGCLEAMALDGGSSTQLYTNLPNFSVQVTSAATVANALIILPKQ